jgi:hypothetical protein
MNFLRSHKADNRLSISRASYRAGRSVIVAVLVAFMLWHHATRADDVPLVRFVEEPARIQIFVGDRPFATYVYQDEKIPRPYFCDVRAPDGTQVTRNHPPVAGSDPTDHATYHPGIWLAFGDISGADFWRNRARVEHEKFVEEPVGGARVGTFAVQNAYVTRDGTTACREMCRYRIIVQQIGCFLLCDSTFFSEERDFVFGDQEEMGLGIRMATALIVNEGGSIVNSAGLKDEKGAWGTQAAWCDYSGVIGNRRYGVTLMPHPENFRPSWFHARDYGLLAANPFGRNAFTGAEKSAVVVKKGERFRLRFGLFMYAAEVDSVGIPATAYRQYLELVASAQDEG